MKQLPPKVRHNSENHTTTLLKNDVKKLRSFEGQVSDTPVGKFLWCVCNHHASPYVMGVSYLKMSSHGTDGKLVGNCSQLINSTIPDLIHGEKNPEEGLTFLFYFCEKKTVVNPSIPLPLPITSHLSHHCMQRGLHTNSNTPQQMHH